MKNIIASERQKNCRNLFKEAAAFASSINNNPEKKKEFLNKISKDRRVFNLAVKEYLMHAKKKNTIVSHCYNTKPDTRK